METSALDVIKSTLMTISYRHPTKGEANTIFQKGCRCFNIKRYPYSLWSLDAVRQLLSHPEFCWVAEEGPEIIGFIGTHKSPPSFPQDHGFVEWCFVIPSHRGRGIAPELYQRAEDTYIRSGKQYIVANTTPDNSKVIAFLRRKGYAEYAHDIFFRKKLLSQPGENPISTQDQLIQHDQSKTIPIFQSAEKFFQGAFYAIILATLLANLDIQPTKISFSIPIFLGLLLTITRWFHLHVLLVDIGKYPYSQSHGLTDFVTFYIGVFILCGFYFSAKHQAHLPLVFAFLCIACTFDLLWEILTVTRSQRLSDEAMLMTAKRWLIIDVVCLLALAFLIIGVVKFPQFQVLYARLFTALALAVSIYDYLSNRNFYLKTKMTESKPGAT